MRSRSETEIGPTYRCICNGVQRHSRVGSESPDLDPISTKLCDRSCLGTTLIGSMRTAKLSLVLHHKQTKPAGFQRGKHGRLTYRIGFLLRCCLRFSSSQI